MPRPPQDATLPERLLRQERRIVFIGIALLFALTAAYTVSGVGMRMSALEMTEMQRMRDMPAPHLAGDWSATYGGVVFAMWWVMMVAMMLPSVTPTVLLFGALIRSSASPHPAMPTMFAFLSGYLLVWGGFSLAATALHWAAEAAGIVSAGMMSLINSTPGAVMLIAAGIFQFTPLKNRCLLLCQSPAVFLTRHYRTGPYGALHLGMRHGLFCLGCCWAIMTLLFVGGVMNLYWICAIAAFVALEKLGPAGVTLARISGGGLICWGAALLLSGI